MEHCGFAVDGLEIEDSTSHPVLVEVLREPDGSALTIIVTVEADTYSAADAQDVLHTYRNALDAFAADPFAPVGALTQAHATEVV